MFTANAVWSTAVENEFNPAGFTVEVEVEPVSTNLMPQSLSTLMDHMRQNRCDGFTIDLGTSTKYFIKSK